jgi:hypothetical protein
LNRHVKGHKRATPIRSPNGEDSLVIDHSEIVPGSVQVPPNHAECMPVAASTSQLEEGHTQRFPYGGALLWPAQETGPPNNNAPQPDLSSSLLWPDSQNLFLSLTDGALWDQCMPGLISLENLPQGGPQAIAAPPVMVGNSPYDEPTVTEDGRRAVQTTNGLLTNTVREHRASRRGNLRLMTDE